MKGKTRSDIKGILKPIDHYLNRIENEISDRLKTGIPIIDESALHIFKMGGKRIRASLIVLCSGLKNNIPDDIISVAAAAEIVHSASLVHDDIIDESEFRRGDLTVSSKWGNKIAVLVGDYMYTRALDIAITDTRSEIFPVMVAATRDMVKGELYQIEYSSIDTINEAHYYKIIELKTARFMAACAKLGAVKAGMSSEESEILYDFGLNLGYAFQIVDDTLDIIDSYDTGKDVGNDFYNGKITLPILHLLETSEQAERNSLLEFLNMPDESKWQLVRNKIMDSGSIDYCISIAAEYVSKALKDIEFFPSSIYKDVIIELSKFLLERRY